MEKLEILGTKLAETIANITSDVRLGFGSFIDNQFKNHMSLSANATEFIVSVQFLVY